MTEKKNDTTPGQPQWRDIVAEMRECEGWRAYYDGGKYHDSGYESVVSVWSLHDYADQIEEAVTKEELKWAKTNGELAMLLDPEKIPMGNVAKLREALESICARASIGGEFDPHAYLDEIHAIANTALAAPARNCDVGTPEEQIERHIRSQLAKGRCCQCEENNCRPCFAKWAQMPYETEKEGDDNGSK